MTIVNKKSRYRLYFTAMIFAFLWVIIGDLVAMHIRVIAGIDLYGCHQPFAKTHKDQKNFKVKNHKSVDNSKIINSFLSADKLLFSANYFIKITICNFSSVNIILQSLIPDNTLRGSPSIS